MVNSDKLFSRGNLSDILLNYLKGAKNAVDEIKKSQFENNTDDQIIKYLIDSHQREPLEIFPGDMVRSEPREVVLNDVPSIEFDLEIPFVGDSTFWHYKPSSFLLAYPFGIVKRNASNNSKGILKVTHTFYQSNYQPEYVRKDIDENIERINQFIGFVKEDIEKFNNRIENEIPTIVKRRREKLELIDAATEQLEIPLKPRDGSPPFEEIPLRKKKIRPLATEQEKKKKQEYAISQEGYETILQLIRHVGISFERTPSTFNIHDEEELRNIIIAFLNGYFEGGATGETFRKKGETDICIEEENRAAFVAECKIWRGEKALNKAVDQLLGYLTWRDVKTSLVVFNMENKDFSHIQDTVPEAMRNHPNFIREIDGADPGEWQFMFKSINDERREVIVHVFVFDIYCQ